MSIDEQDRIRGRAMRLRKEKEAELKMVRCKMREFGETLDALSRGLTGKCGLRIHQETGGFIVRNPPHAAKVIPACPTHEELFQLLQEMEQLSADIQQLEQDLS